MKELADVALDAAKGKGASYADIRINRFKREFIFSREDRIQNTVSLDAFGFGVRVLVDGVWGFAAASKVDKDTIARMAVAATDTAKANKILQKDRCLCVRCIRNARRAVSPLDTFAARRGTRYSSASATNGQ